MSTHHPYGPSRHNGLRQCPCFEGSEIAGHAAERGTLQHRALESLLKNMDGKPIDPLGLTEEEFYGVAWAEDYIRREAKGSKILTETKVAYYEDLDDFEPLYDGTADALIITGKTGSLFDYKSGRDHDYQPQMMAYAAAVCQQYGLIEVNVYILFGATKTYQYYLYNGKEAAQYAKATIEAAQMMDRKPKPCSYCKWCKHAATCPALAEQALAVVSGRPEWGLVNYDPKQISDPREMSRAKKMSNMLKSWCDSVDFQALEMIKRGESIPGFKVSKRSGAREVIDPWTAYDKCQFDVAKFLNCCTVKITALEKLVGKKKFGEISGDFVAKKPDQFFLVEEKEAENAAI